MYLVPGMWYYVLVYMYTYIHVGSYMYDIWHLPYLVPVAMAALTARGEIHWLAHTDTPDVQLVCLAVTIVRL